MNKVKIDWSPDHTAVRMIEVSSASLDAERWARSIIAERDQLKAQVEELRKALEMAERVISGTSLEHVWLNAPEKPEQTPMTIIRAALAKASQ